VNSLRRPSCLFRSSAVLRLAALGFTWGINPGVSAQPIIPGERPPEVAPASIRQPGSRPGSPPPSAAPPAAPEALLRYGPLRLSARLTERFLYAEGLRSLRGATVNSYQNVLSPGISVDIGQNWSADYQAAWTWYSGAGFRETLDHQLRFAGRVSLRTWSGQFDQGYAHQTEPLVETGRQTTSEIVGTRLSLTKGFDRRLSASATFAQDLRFVGGAPDSYTWRTEQALVLRLGLATELTGGIAAGYIDMDPGANMAFVQPRLRLGWTPASSKVSGSITVGENVQQIFSRGVSAVFTPVFEFSGSYRPFAQTELTASAGRTVSPSVLRNQITDATVWQVGFRQRVLGRINLSGRYGEQETGYSATQARVEAGRKDRSHTYGLRAEITLRRRVRAAVFHQSTDNASNREGFAVRSNQTGTEISYRY
jgi:hypothetical protein